MVLPLLGGILSGLSSLVSGFGMGAGYGSGVRFGFEDLYPLFKDNVTALGRALFPVPFAESGFTGAYQIKQSINQAVPSTQQYQGPSLPYVNSLF